MPTRTQHRRTATPLGRGAAAMAVAAAFGFAAVVPGPAFNPALAQAPAGATAPAARPVAATPGEARLSQPQLEQLLAPIALYPDELLMQMLMAATYPLEVVQAQRWLGQGQNAQLRGDALAQALEAQSWDPSVKSLVPFPDVLKMMNDQLEWTQQVGDARAGAAGRRAERRAGAARPRAGRRHAAERAAADGTVNTNVTVARRPRGAPPPVVPPPPQIIVIEPTQPDTVYVPAYDPTVVYRHLALSVLSAGLLPAAAGLGPGQRAADRHGLRRRRGAGRLALGLGAPGLEQRQRRTSTRTATTTSTSTGPRSAATLAARRHAPAGRGLSQRRCPQPLPAAAAHAGRGGTREFRGRRRDQFRGRMDNVEPAAAALAGSRAGRWPWRRRGSGGPVTARRWRRRSRRPGDRPAAAR